jgi:DNA polymerase III epsilon subunit family exonuclease
VSAEALAAAPFGDAPVAVLDFETTGLDAQADRVCEAAVLRLEPGAPPKAWSSLVQPGVPMPAVAEGVHGITDRMLDAAPAWPDVWPPLAALLEGAVVVAHNAPFDIGFLRAENARHRLPAPVLGPVLDTLPLARQVYGLPRCSLADLARRLEIPQASAHRALADCTTTAALARALLAPLEADAPLSLGAVLALIEARRAGGPHRLATEARLRGGLGRPALLEYTNRLGPGPLLSRRLVTVRRIQGQRFEGYCHLAGEHRGFHLSRLVRVEGGPGFAPGAPPFGR